jgi:hypothetical protein
MAVQPEGSAYVIFAVPNESPFTKPEAEPMLAIPGALELQVPPGTLLDKVIDEPRQAPNAPVIGASG